MSLFLEAGGVLKAFQEQYSLDLGRKILTGLTFLGAGAAPALFIAPWLWSRAGRFALCTGGVAIAVLTLILTWSGWQAGVPETSYSWWFWPQYGLWIAAGLHVMALAIVEIWNRRDCVTVLLVLWLGGTISFGMFLNHFLNIRVILPALLVVALLCARRLRKRTDAGSPVSSKPVWVGLTAGLVLSLCIAYSDTTLANSARTAAERIAPENRSGRTWFSGHWGFQYYMEARGAQPVDVTSTNIQAGDTIVTPMSGSNRLKFRASSYLDESFELPVCSWLTTMGAECGAGFYSELWGPLPFVFGPVPPERYEVIVP